MIKMNLFFLAFILSFFSLKAQHVLNFPIPSCPYVFIEKGIIDESINIYPNPSQDILNIELTESQKNIQIHIYDILGKCVYYESIDDNNKTSINLSTFSKGTYLLSLKIDKRNLTRRFIIY